MSGVKYTTITTLAAGEYEFTNRELWGRTIKAVTVGNINLESTQYSFSNYTLTITDDSVISTIDAGTEITIVHQWVKKV